MNAWLDFKLFFTEPLPDCVPSAEQRVFKSKEHLELEKEYRALERKKLLLEFELSKLKNKFDADLNEKIKQKDEEREKSLQDLVQHFQDESEALHDEIQDVHDHYRQQLAHTWEIDRSNLVLAENEIIGTGGWGKVFKGKFRGLKVAVKQLHDHIVSEHNEAMVRREINIMAQVRHPNLLLFLGAIIVSNVEQGGASSLIVTELLDISLRSAYQQNKITPECKIPVLSDVACGLAYLHSHRDPIIHRDVSSANVLLEAVRGSRQWKAKLSDFGSANILSKAVTPNAGAVIYAAPEIISESASPQTTKVDVYSFGVLTCEIVLLRPPPDERRDFPKMLSDVRRRSTDLFGVAKDCTKRFPAGRPTITQVAEKLS